MDSRCKHCGEPFDLDEFHGLDEPWEKWVKAFRRDGCGAADAAMNGQQLNESKRCRHEPLYNEAKLEGISLIHELLGDDVDGACTMIDDYMMGE